MRKPLIASILVVPAVLGVLAAPLASARAEHGEPFKPAVVGLGLAFGDPTSLDIKFWVGHSSGIDIGFGLSHFSERLGVYGEFELGLVDFWIENAVSGVFYVGLGGALALHHAHDDLALALVIPIGVNFRFRIPLEVFIEARPGFELLDRDGFGIGGQVGIRYVF